MASSNIKLFDENKGNMLSDSEFSISNQRMNGLQTGVASSQLQNKAMYQASLVAYAIAQVMMQNGKNANDTDAVSAFVSNLSGTMLQKVYDIATTAEAQAGVATGKWMSPALVKAAIDSLAAKAQNILSNETKVLLGLGSDAVPDAAFVVLKNLIDGISASSIGAARIELGNYTGTGAIASTAKTLTFSFKPKVVIITGPSNGWGKPGFAIFMQGAAQSQIYVEGGYANTFNLTWSGNSVTWTGDNWNAELGLNANKGKYYYVAIG